ncbi:hypothetical protein Tco_0897334 [Tanacetum coccineum]
MVLLLQRNMPPSIEESMAYMAKNIAKLIATNTLHNEQLAASTAKLKLINKELTIANAHLLATISKTKAEFLTANTKTDITETTTKVKIETTSPIIDIKNHDKTMTPVFTASSPVTKRDNVTTPKTTTDHVVTETTSLITKINKTENNIVMTPADSVSSMTEEKNEVATQARLSLSSLPTLPANPTRKIPKVRHDIAIFHRINLHETYETYCVATFIDEKFAVFCFTETIHHGHQCPPPKFVFLRTEPKPPWEPCDPVTQA